MKLWSLTASSARELRDSRTVWGRAILELTLGTLPKAKRTYGHKEIIKLKKKILFITHNFRKIIFTQLLVFNTELSL